MCVRRKRTNTNGRKERKEKRIFCVGTQQTYRRKTVNAREREKNERKVHYSLHHPYIYISVKKQRKERKKAGQRRHRSRGVVAIT